MAESNSTKKALRSGRAAVAEPSEEPSLLIEESATAAPKRSRRTKAASSASPAASSSAAPSPSTPDEIDAVIDSFAQKRKRGRPRKQPAADAPAAATRKPKPQLPANDPYVGAVDAKLQATRAEILSLSPKAADAIYYMPLPIVLASMPYREPLNPDGTPAVTYVRESPKLTIRLGTVRPDVGLIYGAYGRLIFGYVLTESLTKGTRLIDLGGKISAMADLLNIPKTGGARGGLPRLRNHWLRFRYATFLFEWHKRFLKQTAQSVVDVTRVDDLLLPVVERAHFWEARDPQGGRGIIDDSDNYLYLTESFFNEITTKAVPIDMRAFAALQSSSMAMDMYTFFAWFSSFLQGNVVFSWEELKNHFGYEYARMVDFRRSFRTQMTRVLAVYPELHAFDLGEKGVEIKATSKPPILRNKPLRILASPEAKARAVARGENARAYGKAFAIRAEQAKKEKEGKAPAAPKASRTKKAGGTRTKTASSAAAASKGTQKTKAGLKTGEGEAPPQDDLFGGKA